MWRTMRSSMAMMVALMVAVATLGRVGAAPASGESLYDMFGVPATATIERIATKYHHLSSARHPLIDPTPESRGRFDELSNAFEVLADPVMRAAYDESRAMPSTFMDSLYIYELASKLVHDDDEGWDIHDHVKEIRAEQAKQVKAAAAAEASVDPLPDPRLHDGVAQMVRHADLLRKGKAAHYDARVEDAMRERLHAHHQEQVREHHRLMQEHEDRMSAHRDRITKLMMEAKIKAHSHHREL